MKKWLLANAVSVLPWAAAALAAVAIVFWLRPSPDARLTLRAPGTDGAPGTADDATNLNPVLAGKLIRSDGQASDMPGEWSQFRGVNRDGLSPEPVKPGRSWDAAGPRQLWSHEVGEGYAGAAVRNGCVYLMDYDQTTKQDVLRCWSLADGKEIWRYAYHDAVKRNHGMSRTVPAVSEKLVVAIGPKCHVVCLDAGSGELRWGLDLVRQFGATVPPWYTGQCPLFDGSNVILAPGGKDALLLAVEAETGKVVWKTPNPNQWKMTHSSVMPMEFAGRRMYVYCASLGVVGVSAADGSILWENKDWKISLATVPSPVPVGEGRIFLSGGYDAGSLMLQLREEGGRISADTLFKLGPEIFGATQQTPIFHEQHLFGVRPDGRFVCLDLTGKVVWLSERGQSFGLGSFLMADGLIFALNDSGKLSLIEATPQLFRQLGQAQVLSGRESWGPMALAGGRLIARDLTRIVCLDVGQK